MGETSYPFAEIGDMTILCSNNIMCAVHNYCRL